MNTQYPHIFAPLTIRGITLKNRIEVAPVSVFDLDTTPERHPSERDMQFFRMRAMGGAAVVTLGDCIVDPSGEDSGLLGSPKILAANVDNLPFLTRIADEIHRYGAIASIELNHAGMLRASEGVQAWGPDYINFDETKTIAPLSDQSASDEPVMLVFFGDHLPYLGDDQLAYRELGFTEDPAWDALTSYETPYVIWANDAGAEVLDWESMVVKLDLPENGQLSASFLGAAVLELTGRTGASPWFDFLNQLRREVPVVQKQSYQLADGTITDQLPENLAAEILKWRQWSYYKLMYKEID